MSGDDTSVEPVETPPLLRIVTPDTTPEEVAALVAVLASLGPARPPAPRPVSEWNRPSRLTRVSHRHGPGGWVASGQPR